jgi:hypothetical protein
MTLMELHALLTQTTQKLRRECSLDLSSKTLEILDVGRRPSSRTDQTSHESKNRTRLPWVKGVPAPRLRICILAVRNRPNWRSVKTSGVSRG